MATEDLPPHQRERLQVIRQSGESLLAVLNDLLDLSKIEAGKLELEDTDFDLDDLARSALATFSALAAAKGLQLKLVVSSSAGGVYRGDPLRVRQILHNLISNALKFTERGRVSVSVRRLRGRVVLTVRDTGIGIPKGKLAQLFDKFEQADRSTTRRFGGTGLGLAICRELAHRMGGAVRVISRPGQGALFVVELDLARVDQAILVEEPPRAPPQQEPTRGLRILAAEDNNMNQLVLKTLLNQLDIEPLMVSNGLEAVEAWERGGWDLILMDVQMPLVDGPTAAGVIRSREAAESRAHTPIFALTANAMSHQQAEYEAAGMDGVIAKPIQVEQLYAALARFAAQDPEAAHARSKAAARD